MSGFPVKLIGSQELKQRCISEGLRYTAVFALNNVAYTVGDQNLGPIEPKKFKAFFIDTMFVSTNCDIQATIEGGITLSTTGSQFGISYLPKGKHDFKLDFLSRRNMLPMSVIVNSNIDFSPSARIGVPNLSTITVAKAALVAVGSGFTFVVTVTNTAGVATSVELKINDLLPDGLSYSSAVGAGWTFTPNGNGYLASTNDVIAAGGNKTYTVTVFPTKRVRIFVTAVGYMVDHDINYDAPAIVWNGTSITAESNPATYKTSYTFLIRNFLRDQRGINTRIINRAEPGSTSSFHEAARAFDNRYDLPEVPWAAIWEHGINDQSQGISNAVTLANALAYIKHWRRISKNIYVFVFAPYPTSDVVLEAGLVSRRAALKEGIAASIYATDPRVIYIEEMGSLFNPVTEGATYLSDTIHLNDAGNGLVFNQFTNTIIAKNINS